MLFKAASGGIVIVRHGATEWSTSGRHTSRTDLPLLPEGRRRAQALASVVNPQAFDLVLCSPLLRARETCELAGLAEHMEICEDLREWDYGEYEGLTTPEIRRERPDWSLWRDGCPGGESPEQVAARADRVTASARRDQTTIAFAHGHVLRVLAARWVEMGPASGSRLALSAGAIGTLGHEHDTRVIENWNVVV